MRPPPPARAAGGLPLARSSRPRRSRPGPLASGRGCPSPARSLRHAYPYRPFLPGWPSASARGLGFTQYAGLTPYRTCRWNSRRPTGRTRSIHKRLIGLGATEVGQLLIRTAPPERGCRLAAGYHRLSTGLSTDAGEKWRSGKDYPLFADMSRRRMTVTGELALNRRSTPSTRPFALCSFSLERPGSPFTPAYLPPAAGRALSGPRPWARTPDYRMGSVMIS